MKEQDYINVADLTLVRNAYLSLKTITVGNQPAVDPTLWDNVLTDLRQVVQLLENQIEVDE